MMRGALERAPLLEAADRGHPVRRRARRHDGLRRRALLRAAAAERAERAGLPQAVYVAPESLLVFDHLTRRVALLHAGTERDRQALRTAVVNALRGGLDAPERPGNFSQAAASMTQARARGAVLKGKAHIKAGDIYQIVLSVRFAGRTDLDPFQTYRGLRLLNPSPYMYFFELGDLRVAGSSPEALVRLAGRTASLRPIAGTRPRGATPEDDVALEHELLADPKENAEHVMLVDLARNDLGPRRALGLRARGSVSQDRALQPRDAHRERRAGPPRAGARRVRSVRRGVPGRHARRRAEGARDAADRRARADGRGLYGGTVGYFAKNGNMDQAITIRTMVFNGDEYSFQAGGGIVADSSPDTEYQEVLAKSAILRRALELAEEGL